MAGVRLFVYGTLMDAECLRAVAGRVFPSRPARLEGFARFAPAGGYPYVVPGSDAAVDGLLLDDVDAEALRRLDRYEDEGRLYVRRTVEVVVGGARLACEVYVGNPARHPPG